MILVHWSATSSKPFNLVEYSGFIALWRFLNSRRTRVVLPSSNKFKKQLIKASVSVMNRVKAQIHREAEYFAMSTGIWSSETMESYMAITIHYMTKAYNMKDLNWKLLHYKDHGQIIISESLGMNPSQNLNWRRTRCPWLCKTMPPML